MPEQDAVDAAAGALYEAVLDGDWGGALRGLARAFEAPAVCLWRFDYRTHTLADVRMLGHDEQTRALYESHYHRIDPAEPLIVSASPGQWLADEHIFDRRSPHHGEFTHDFALPQGIGWCAGAKVDAPSWQCGQWFGVQRYPDDRPFGRQGERVFERLLPHLQRAAQLETRMRSLAWQHELSNAVLNALDAAVFVLNIGRQVRTLNAAAEGLLAGDPSLRIANGRLIGGDERVDARLRRFVSGACAPVPAGGAFLVARSAASPLQVMVLPLSDRLRAHALAAASEPLALVVVGDADRKSLDETTYRALFGLTPTEAALLGALVAGETLQGWATARGVSISTARTHLSQLFDKTGTSSQARLVSMATTLPRWRVGR
jgi:DNA-binding CsgD family transcriptional regulator